MEVITGFNLQRLVDYDFGDHIGASEPEYTHGGFMKPANISNAEFLLLCKKFEGRVMTLFIDNIRLYNRPVYANEGPDAEWVKYLLTYNDLLALCAVLTNNKFIIFTSHEDTPIDEYIKLPDNVLAVYATNAIYNDDRVIPFPYGLQRPLGRDNRLQIIREELDVKIEPTKLLYINCGIERHKEREPLINFEGLPWATTRFDKDSKFFPYERYRDFLDEMRDHKFMICPQGHGIDCHRNWELLYMKRVPVMRKHPYFERLMKGFPVLFVDNWYDVTEGLLNASDHLFDQAQVIPRESLDLNTIYAKIIEKHK